MKFYFLDTYYQAFLDSFYKEHSSLSKQPYNIQKQAFLDEKFGTADFYSINLNKLGHEARDVIINDCRLQKKWAQEHRLPFWQLNNQEKILEAQIEDFKPDIIYCYNLRQPGTQFLRKFKSKKRLIVGQVAAGIDFDRSLFSSYNLIITSFPHYVSRFHSLGIPCEYLQLAFESSVLDKLVRSKKRHGAVFVGGFSNRHLAKDDFLNNFEYLAGRVSVEFWGYGTEYLHPDSPILKSFYGPAWGIDMYNLLYNAKISLNRHVPAAENYANNMRLYESTGVGTMLITDYKDNLHELFAIGKEVETYKTKEELVDKIKYYLSHEKEREKIAKAGQKRTLKDHTYKVRTKELVAILGRYMV